MAYKESVTVAIGEIERLRHENAILHSGVHPPSDQDRELKEVYRRLGNTEHGWNHTRLLLDITREEVETRTHRIIHLEHHVEVQDTELEERAETITNLEQQLLEFQGQAPPEQTHRRANSHRTWTVDRMRQVKTRWKAEDVFYLFGIRLTYRFQIKQHQISIYWLLLAVKSELALLFGVPCSDVILLEWT
jgi:predicted RNase H-like nuclease (RuvC/YqgF family)